MEMKKPDKAALERALTFMLKNPEFTLGVIMAYEDEIRKHGRIPSYKGFITRINEYENAIKMKASL